ncbi:MAG: hypothetical protein LBM96_01800 [Methanobrevibacter sp.]|jgi:hypothetical protein|nr:hypothetical protein [Candidatus Methanoflexus mossambicus]
MITITKKEQLVLNEIKVKNLEFSNGVPTKILKMELGFTEHELNDILNELSKKETIDYIGSKVKIINQNKEISAVKTKNDVKNAEINEQEAKTLEIIKKLVNEDNTLSKYYLEGHLLYGKLKLSNLRMYKTLLSLENKKIIKKINKKDGKYYVLLNS